jgi:hypothetical protein
MRWLSTLTAVCGPALAGMVLAASTAAPGGPAVDPSTPRDPRIYAINGQFKDSPADADQMARALQGLVGAPVTPIWNPGDGRLADLGESANHWARYGVEFVERGVNAVGGLLGAAPVDLNANRAIVDDLKARIRHDLSNNQPVMLVAHSQGNFVANQAYQELVAEGQPRMSMVGIVGVGSPDSRSGTMPNSSYVNYAGDIVINPIPGAPQANVTSSCIESSTMFEGVARGPAPNCTPGRNIALTSAQVDWTGHGFNETYLSDDVSTRNGGPTIRQLLLRDIQAISRQIQVPGNATVRLP